MADLTNIIPINETNLNILKAGGTVTKDGHEYTKDNHALYLPTTTSADLIADGASKKFVTNFVDNGTYVSLTIDGVTFNLQKYNP